MRDYCGDCQANEELVYEGLHDACVSSATVNDCGVGTAWLADRFPFRSESQGRVGRSSCGNIRTIGMRAEFAE